MSKIKIDLELALETIAGFGGEIELLATEATGESRWAIIYTATFKFKGKYYQMEYRRGTGDSGESPFEYHDGPVECVEVEPYEVAVIKYRPIEDSLANE